MFRNASYGSIVSNQKLPPFHPSMHPAGSGFSRDPDSSPEYRSVWFLGLHARATPGYIAGPSRVQAGVSQRNAVASVSAGQFSLSRKPSQTRSVPTSPCAIGFRQPIAPKKREQLSRETEIPSLKYRHSLEPHPFNNIIESLVLIAHRVLPSYKAMNKIRGGSRLPWIIIPHVILPQPNYRRGHTHYTG